MAFGSRFLLRAVETAVRRRIWKFSHPSPFDSSLGRIWSCQTVSFHAGVFKFSEGNSHPFAPVSGDVFSHALRSASNPLDIPANRMDFLVLGVSMSPR